MLSQRFWTAGNGWWEISFAETPLSGIVIVEHWQKYGLLPQTLATKADAVLLRRAKRNYTASRAAGWYEENAADLTVHWLDPGEEFMVHEYDWMESLRKKEDTMFFTA